MERVIILALALALSGCHFGQVKPPEQKIVYVDKPIKVACVDKAPEKPVYQYGKGDEPSGKEKAGILISDKEAAQRYATAWEAAAAGCIKPQ